jgi:predicted TIM-barrel fold metal-dependent hydrolase
MYIDIHTHIACYQLYPETYLAGMLRSESGHGDNKANLAVQLLLKDKNCEAMLRQMDAAGVDKAVLLVLDGGVGLGEAGITIDEIFALHYRVLQSHPDRFIVFGGVDPRRGMAGFDLFKKGVFDYGFRGMKLYPPMGYAINDESLLPFYEICNQLQLPVLIHTGPSLPILHNEFAQPATFQSILESYTNINFILAHQGYRLKDPVIQQLIRLDNVYLDISGFQMLNYKADEIRENLKMIFLKNYNKKILYGSDWPLFNLFRPLNKDIDVLKAIFEEVKNDVPVNALNNVMHDNAKRVLGL